MAITKISPDLVDFDSALVVSPTLTIGDATAEDTKIVFDGNAQDYYIGLDDSADDLKIGLGSAVGTTHAITVGADQSVDFSKGIVVEGSGATAGVYLNGTNSDSIAQGNFVRYGTNFLTQSNAANSDLITYAFNGSTFVNALNISPSGGVTVNSSQNSNINFIAKSGSDANALVLDGSSGALGLGAAPVYGRLDIRQTGTGAQDRCLWLDMAPASSGSNNNAMVINVGNANMTNTVMRIHHESPAANQKLLSLDTTGSNTEKFWVDEDGDAYFAGTVTMPNQPAFLVRPTSEESNIANSTTVAFGTEVFDVGSNFASNQFTAPVDGKYQLNMNIRFNNMDQDATYAIMRLTTSNRTFDAIIEPNSLANDPAYWVLSTSVLADMDASDTAKVVFYFSGGTAQADVGSDSSFSGYLVA